MCIYNDRYNSMNRKKLSYFLVLDKPVIRRKVIYIKVINGNKEAYLSLSLILSLTWGGELGGTKT